MFKTIKDKFASFIVRKKIKKNNMSLNCFFDNLNYFENKWSNSFSNVIWPPQKVHDFLKEKLIIKRKKDNCFVKNNRKKVELKEETYNLDVKDH